MYYEDASIAINLVKYHTYSEILNLGPTAYKLPVYPLFVSFFIFVFNDNWIIAVVTVQHFLFFFVPFLIVRFCRLYNKEKAGILAGYIFILSPAYFYYPNIIEVTNLFIPLFILWVTSFTKLCFQNNTTKKNLLEISFFSILTAVLFLTQVIIVPIAIIMIAALYFYNKISVKQLIYIFLLASLIYSPWVIRNYYAFDSIVLTKTPMWMNVFYSLTPDVNLLDEVKVISSGEEYSTITSRQYINEFQMEEIYKSKAILALRGKESIFVIKALQNIVLLWYVPPKYFNDNSMAIILGRKVWTVFFNIVTFLYLLKTYREKRIFFMVLMIIFGGFTVPYMIGHAANVRFKLDFEWIQYILTAIYLLHKFGYQITERSVAGHSKI